MRTAKISFWFNDFIATPSATILFCPTEKASLLVCFVLNQKPNLFLVFQQIF